MAGFWFGVNEEVRRNYAAAPAGPGEPAVAEITFTTSEHGGRYWVYLWSVDQAGNFSSRRTFDFFVQSTYVPPPPPVRVARWNMRGNGVDVVGDNDLTINGTVGVDYAWVDDQTCYPESALRLYGSGGSYARTDSALIAVDESFTAAAWVHLEDLPARNQTVLSQAGKLRPAMHLSVTSDGRWLFAVPGRNPRDTSSGVAVTAPGSVPLNTWNHVAGVFDADEGELLLYVNGRLAVTAAASPVPQPAAGAFYVGAAGTERGRLRNHLDGAVETIEIFSSTVSAEWVDIRGGSGGGWYMC